MEFFGEKGNGRRDKGEGVRWMRQRDSTHGVGNPVG